jgi:gliding motility-associated-like protein
MCIDSAAINMVASNPGGNCGVVVSEGFTPNGDGINDFLFVRGLSEFPDNELVIFNRWGELVWQSYDHTEGWDGSYGVEALDSPSGTYIWVISFKPKDNDDKLKITGFVNLLR